MSHSLTYHEMGAAWGSRSGSTHFQNASTATQSSSASACRPFAPCGHAMVNDQRFFFFFPPLPLLLPMVFFGLAVLRSSPLYNHHR